VSAFYLDASALVKRYLAEVGSVWIARLSELSSGNSITIAEITQVEVAAALAGRHRASGGISRRERDGAVDLLARHCKHHYQLVATTPLILDRAIALTQQYRLRGYDAVQLATAVTVNEALIAAGFAGIVFITADHDLLAAARAEGLAADNPHAHP
jgi:predicted nucleic acid-binding protein